MGCERISYPGVEKFHARTKVWCGVVSRGVWLVLSGNVKSLQKSDAGVRRVRQVMVEFRNQPRGIFSGAPPIIFRGQG